MSRRFNYTGRKKLLRSDVRIRVQEGRSGRAQTFTADVKVPSELKLDPQARVYVEAYVGASSMRFDFGTVAAVTPPDDCALTDIDEGTPVLFRVRVVDETEHVGRVLAAANGIRPEGEDDGKHRKSLLPLRSCDLGEEIWQLKFDPDAGFELAINSRVPNIMEKLKSDSVLMGVIYPEVVRQIARCIWEEDSNVPEDADWLDDWKMWLEELLGRAISEEETPEIDELADDMARSFATRHKFATAMATLMGEEPA
ncbi:MAG: hypothetical protein WBA33_07805 [Rhodanobacter lindaniclasticus]